MPLQTPETAAADKLWALEELPPFPWVATRILQLFSAGSDSVDIRRLMQLIRSDATLSSELLRRANSPLFGARSQIGSLQHAVVMLGMDRVKALAVTAGLACYVKTALKLSVLRRCWRHSLACALVSEELAEACAFPPDQGYTAGLLHDIGRLALLVKHPQAYADLLTSALETGHCLLEGERERFDVDHCEAGAWLARAWDFPPELARIFSNHHRPPEEGPFDLLKLVQVSCPLAAFCGFQVTESPDPGEPSQILAVLPAPAQPSVLAELGKLKERVAGKVAALE